MTNQAPMPGSASNLIWSVLLDEEGRDDMVKQIADEAGDAYEPLLQHYIDQAGLQNSPPADRVQGYRVRPIGDWHRMRTAYRKFYDEDMRDFRKLDPESAYMLEMFMLQLDAADEMAAQGLV